jgi:hypothetical protein
MLYFYILLWVLGGAYALYLYREYAYPSEESLAIARDRLLVEANQHSNDLLILSKTNVLDTSSDCHRFHLKSRWFKGFSGYINTIFDDKIMTFAWIKYRGSDTMAVLVNGHEEWTLIRTKSVLEIYYNQELIATLAANEAIYDAAGLQWGQLQSEPRNRFTYLRVRETPWGHIRKHDNRDATRVRVFELKKDWSEVDRPLVIATLFIVYLWNQAGWKLG